jgi:hypothetical protein
MRDATRDDDRFVISFGRLDAYRAKYLRAETARLSRRFVAQAAGLDGEERRWRRNNYILFKTFVFILV